jgi:hypothetical protein
MKASTKREDTSKDTHGRMVSTQTRRHGISQKQEKEERPKNYSEYVTVKDKLESEIACFALKLKPHH